MGVVVARFFRSCLSGLCFFIFGVGGIVIGSVLFPGVALCTGRRRRIVLANVIHRAWQLFVWIMVKCCLISINISDVNRKKLLKARGMVVVANHPSLIDVVILVSIIPNAICVVKESLARNIWVSFIVRMVYITNSGDVVKFLNDTGALLQSGFNIVIFPEGTRTKPGDDVHKIHRGFAHVALHSKSNILPIVIRCNPFVLGKGQAWWNVGDKTVTFDLDVGDVIFVGEVNNDEIFHEKAKKITEVVRRVLFFNT